MPIDSVSLKSHTLIIVLVHDETLPISFDAFLSNLADRRFLYCSKFILLLLSWIILSTKTKKPVLEVAIKAQVMIQPSLCLRDNLEWFGLWSFLFPLFNLPITLVEINLGLISSLNFVPELLHDGLWFLDFCSMKVVGDKWLLGFFPSQLSRGLYLNNKFHRTHLVHEKHLWVLTFLLTYNLLHVILKVLLFMLYGNVNTIK